MFSFKKHSQKEKLIKRSKKRTIVITSVVLIFVIALSLILSLSLRYYPSPGYKYMKHQVGHKNVARSDKIQKRILKDDSDHVGVMFDARDGVSDHAFYGTYANEKKKDQKKAIDDRGKSTGWSEYIEDSKKDKNDNKSWYYIDTARDKGANHYKTKGEAVDEFLVSNKDENSMWIDPVDGSVTDTSGPIPILKTPNEEYDPGFDVGDINELETGKFEFDLKDSGTPEPEVETKSTIEPAKKDKSSPGDEVLFFVNDSGTKTQVSTYTELKTSWLYLEKVNGSYQPQLIIYGLDIGETEGEEAPNTTSGELNFWETMEEDIWNL